MISWASALHLGIENSHDHADILFCKFWKFSRNVLAKLFHFALVSCGCVYLNWVFSCRFRFNLQQQNSFEYWYKVVDTYLYVLTHYNSYTVPVLIISRSGVVHPMLVDIVLPWYWPPCSAHSTNTYSAISPGLRCEFCQVEPTLILNIVHNWYDDVPAMLPDPLHHAVPSVFSTMMRYCRDWCLLKAVVLYFLLIYFGPD